MRRNVAVSVTAILLGSTSLGRAALGQGLDFKTFAYPGSTITTVTGLRGNNMTGNYSIANSGGATGGLLYTLPSLVPAPFPDAGSPPVNFAGATTATPYGPSFGSAGGILRVVGSYKTTATGNGDLGYLYDGAALPNRQITPLVVPGSFNTIAHSNFGNQVVGNWDTANLAPGNAFLYDIPSGTFTTINRPGASSTTAYGVYGNRIAGGSTVGAGLSRAYILNQDTGVYTTYDAPGTGTVVTHFEGITGGGRANTYNLVADSLDSTGAHAWAVHVDAAGVATWTELAVKGASTTSGNSIYGGTAIGVYVVGSVTSAFTVDVPGIYDPIVNAGTLSSAVPGAVLLSGIQGDDIVNNGVVANAGANSTGVNPNTYGVLTNNGTISASGLGASAVKMSGSFGSLLNYGTIAAQPGGVALATDATSAGTLVVNYGTINGQVVVSAGAFARFENSGWMGISSPGAGVVHQVSGTFAQTAAGTLSLRVAPGGVSDQLAVTGVARVAGTAQAVFQPGTYSRSTYTLLTATGGVTGTFSTLSTVNLPAFLSANLGYTPTSVTLSLQSSMASLPGLAGNQGAVARALDGAFNAGGGLNTVAGLYGLSADQLGQALTVLSGSNASVAQSNAVLAGVQFTGLLGGRGLAQQGVMGTAMGTGTAQGGGQSIALAACATEACEPGTGSDPAPWNAWAAGFGGAQWINADQSTGAPAAQQGIAGGAFGADKRIAPQTTLGIAVGLSDSSYSVGATGASGRATGFHVGLYGQQDWDGFYLNAAAAYGRFDGNSTRVIAGIGVTETAKSSAVANQLAGRVEVGRPFALTESTAASRYAVTPFAALQPSQTWTPAYGESSVTAGGAPGVFALSYQAQATTSLPMFLGAQLDAATMINGRPVSAWARVAWQHEFMPNRSVTAGFVTLPGTSFTVDGAPAAANAARFDFGLSYAVAERTALYASGGGELSNRGPSIGGTAGLRISW